MQDENEKQTNLPVATEPHRDKKTWKGYLFEFFMLFLAVFLGFFAENQRENYSERQLELQYINSMVGDLKRDSAFFGTLAAQEKIVAVLYDSIIDLFSQPTRTRHEQQRLYLLARIEPYNITYLKINDRTYEQMKSSGNLRLITNQRISDQISQYYFNSKEIKNNTDETLLRLQRMIELHGRLFDARVFREMVDMKEFRFRAPDAYPKLLTEDKTVINDFLMSLHYLVSISSFSGQYLKQLNAEANSLIAVLQKEYKLK